MSRSETYRTVNAKNTLGAKIGDDVKFILPDMVDILGNTKWNIVPFLGSIIAGILVSRALSSQSDLIRIVVSLLVFVFSNILLRILMQNLFVKENSSKSYNIEIFEVLSEKNIIE